MKRKQGEPAENLTRVPPVSASSCMFMDFTRAVFALSLLLYEDFGIRFVNV